MSSIAYGRMSHALDCASYRGNEDCGRRYFARTATSRLCRERLYKRCGTLAQTLSVRSAETDDLACAAIGGPSLSDAGSCCGCDAFFGRVYVGPFRTSLCPCRSGSFLKAFWRNNLCLPNFNLTRHPDSINGYGPIEAPGASSATTCHGIVDCRGLLRLASLFTELGSSRNRRSFSVSSSFRSRRSRVVEIAAAR